MALCQLIANAQTNDDDAMLALIAKFRPMLYKYARKLETEDAYDDFLADFIEIIRKIKISELKSSSDGALVNYLKRSLHNAYVARIQMLIKSIPTLSFSDLSEAELDMTTNKLSYSFEDEYLANEIAYTNTLTEQETRILHMFFVEEIPVSNIAETLNVSRQNVNQIKNKALVKLKQTA